MAIRFNIQCLVTAASLALLGLDVVHAAEPGTTDTPAVSIGLSYTGDFVGIVSGGTTSQIHYLDDLQLELNFDLDRSLGWSGATAHFTLLHNSGDTPNADALTLQGVDNIEVESAGTRLYEAWVEFPIANSSASVLAGLYDLNSEFYVNESAGWLIAPAFGIGSEMAATGPNGPSIFPSTALALRVRKTFDGRGYVQAAVVNAQSGVLGDDGRLDRHFNHGGLVIGEAGWTGSGTVAVGAWGYTDSQPDWRTPLLPSDERHTAAGAYLILERQISPEHGEGPAITGFARLGISDGKTSPFAGGWQAGILIEQPIHSRPDSVISLGINQAVISRPERLNAADLGQDLARTETALEMTFADRFGRLIIQPDLQYIHEPAGNRAAPGLLIASLRFKMAY